MTPAESGHSVESYFGLVAKGALTPDDRVELLEGVVVAVSPQGPPHAGVTHLAAEALRQAIGDRAAVRIQSPLVLRPRSVPEPDIAVVAGEHRQYVRAHPTTALLVVEVADSSLPQDRITKARIYARAGIPELWVVNLRDDVVEVYRRPDRASAAYRDRSLLGRGERVVLAALPQVEIAVDRLLPPPD